MGAWLRALALTATFVGLKLTSDCVSSAIVVGGGDLDSGVTFPTEAVGLLFRIHGDAALERVWELVLNFGIVVRGWTVVQWSRVHKMTAHRHEFTNQTFEMRGHVIAEHFWLGSARAVPCVERDERTCKWRNDGRIVIAGARVADVRDDAFLELVVMLIEPHRGRRGVATDVGVVLWRRR